MKNKILFPFLSLLFSVAVFGQGNSNICQQSQVLSWSAYTAPAGTVRTPSDAKAIILEIIDVVGLKPNFEIMSANIPNAAAVIYGGKRFILYNPNFINSITATTGSKWAAISILAHEIGHHLDGHTLSQIGSQPQSELEADEFSGFVLRKMGASLADAQVAMKTAASQRGDYTHPGQYDRLTAIADGWNKADAQATGKTYVARSRPAQPVYEAEPQAVQPVASRSAIDDRYILGSVRFNADAGSAYFVTTKYNLVRVRNNQLSVIGKLASLNSSRYPYVIYDDSNTQLLVDAYGNILTRQGAVVGKLSARR